MENLSKFEGSVFTLIGLNIITVIMVLFTLGLATPWALCMLEGWKVKNTVIDGRKLTFDGSGLSLFGNWIKWWFFCLITLGIYSLWIPIKLEQWKVEHTHFAE